MALGILWQWIKKGYHDRVYAVDGNGVLCFSPKDDKGPPENEKQDPFAEKDYYLYDVKLSPFRDLKSKKLVVGIKIPEFGIEQAVSQAENGPRLSPLMSWLDASATVHFNYKFKCNEKLNVRLRDKKTGYFFDPEDPEARIYKKKRYEIYIAPADTRKRLRGVFPGWV